MKLLRYGQRGYEKPALLDNDGGDVISTGTPPGVGLGQKPPLYLRPGQIMRLGISGLGVQEQRTVPTFLA